MIRHDFSLSAGSITQRWFLFSMPSGITRPVQLREWVSWGSISGRGSHISRKDKGKQDSPVFRYAETPVSRADRDLRAGQMVSVSPEAKIQLAARVARLLPVK